MKVNLIKKILVKMKEERLNKIKLGKKIFKNKKIIIDKKVN